MLAKDQLPVISGVPGIKDGTMYDLMLSNLYQTSGQVNAGDYTATIQQAGQADVSQPIHIAKNGKVAFYYDAEHKRIIADDGSIHADKVKHDSWDKNMRSPWGAVAEGTPVTIYNLQGAIVSRQTVSGGLLSIAGLARGVYAVQIGGLGSTLIRK
jgi:hypothetical protein